MTWLSEIFGFFKAFQCWVVIAPWESALRVRRGKKTKVLKPGIHSRIPFLDRIFAQSIRTRAISDMGQTVSTKCGKSLTLSIALFYSIKDIEKLYMTFSNPEQTMLHHVHHLISTCISNKRAEDLSPDVLSNLVDTDEEIKRWGLGDVKLVIVTFAFVRTLRIISNDYRQLSMADEMKGT